MEQIAGRLEISADPASLAHDVAAWMIRTLQGRSSYRVSLSGGSTPKALFQLLASDQFAGQFPWRQVSWFWGDERFLPYDHPDSNYRMTREAMLSKVPVPPENIHPIPTDGTPEDAAMRYERSLKTAYGAQALDAAHPLFDITFLGLGEDGHTASLLPGEPVLEEHERWVAAVPHGRPEVRITQTYPAINSSRHIAFLAAGKGKAAILREVRSGNCDAPAARLRPAGELIWFVDRAAAP